jgi:acetoin utilization deacetylase AcuC-like enzyme
MSVALFTHPDMLAHRPGVGHPESPERLQAVLDALDAADLGLDRHAATEAAVADLERLHPADHVARLLAAAPDSGLRQLDADTVLSPGSVRAARLAAGAVIDAVRAVARGETARAFAAVRPPGHHATPDRGMGFCLFNNVALAARHAQARHGVERVLIADWDVHHGNGTQDIFYEDGSVLFFDTHQSPLYPGTGAAGERGRGPGAGRIFNNPFPAGAGRAEIVGAFRDRLMPAADAFRPELVLVSAGFDSRADDPLGGFRLTDDDFAELTRIVTDIAARHCQGRLVSTLEGGYDPEGLAAAAASHVRALLV